MKWLRTTLCLAAMLALLLSVFPAAAEGTVSYHADAAAIQVDCGACSPGGAYMVFFLRDGASPASPEAADILFLDQVSADASGRFSLLYVGAEFASCQVVLSGSFPGGGASPRLIGQFPPQGNLSILNMPRGLLRIEDEAFTGGTFTHVYLGESVQSIGSRAFADCSGLQLADIPSSVTFIADDAFSSSPGVTIQGEEGSEAQAFAERTGLPFRVRQP